MERVSGVPSSPDAAPLTPWDLLVERVSALELLVGEEGSTIHKRDPSGLHAAIARLIASTDRLVAVYEASERRAAAITGPAGRLGFELARLVLAAAFGAFLLYLAGFHR